MRVVLLLDASQRTKLEKLRKKLTEESRIHDTFKAILENIEKEFDTQQLNAKPYYDFKRDFISPVRNTNKSTNLPTMQMFTLSQHPDRSARRKRWEKKEWLRRLLLIKLYLTKKHEQELIRKLAQQGHHRIIRISKTGHVQVIGIK